MTKRVVERSGEYCVVAGYFAVAPDKCVKKKVSSFKVIQNPAPKDDGFF